MENKFIIRMDPDASREYEKLDNSIIGEVDTALESLEKRADEVGKPLGKKFQINLTGSKEKKLRSSGIRIIYTITNDYVDILRIVVILTVAYKKNEIDVYKTAEHRAGQYIKVDIENSNTLIPWYSENTEVSEPSNLDESDTYLYFVIEEVSNSHYKLRHEVIDDVVGKGQNFGEAMEDLGANLLNYANTYMASNEYYNDPTTFPHLRYVLQIINLAGELYELHHIVENLRQKV